MWSHERSGMTVRLSHPPLRAALLLFLGATSLASCQADQSVRATTLDAEVMTKAEVLEQVRASLGAWNTGDIETIVSTPGISNNDGIGFGWRGRAARLGETQEFQAETIRPFFARVESYRIVDEEIDATVDSDFGFAWGVFTEEIKMPGEALQRVDVRFTTVFKKESDGLRQVFFHRDAQRFDEAPE